MNYELEGTVDLGEVVKSKNISDLLSVKDLETIGQACYEEFNVDNETVQDWMDRNKDILKLALQVSERKTFPWEGAANVKFPLLTIAALQFHSRAYPALVMGAMPVACRIAAPAPTMIMPPKPQQPQQGQQPTPQMQQQAQAYQQAMQKIMKQNQEYQTEKLRAQRISEHMSYQILEEDVNWEEETDKLLFVVALAGTAFKKTYFDPIANSNVSECVLPSNLIVSYFTKTLETAPRISHILYMSRNDIVERQRRGIFNEFAEGSEQSTLNLIYKKESNEREHVEPPINDSDRPFELIEQHRYLDLDGDGYAEPYIVTFRYDTKQVMRIVARFTQGDVSIDPKTKQVTRIVPVPYFTKFPFIPSPDGGFYGLGFGALLTPLNESINATINQLLDAGALSNAGGGFLGRGFKARKGDMKFRLNEWKQVDCSGDDLRKSIFPMPTREPSQVLFSLLTLMIQYGEQVAGAADIMQGKNPGQNTPAETSRTMVEQGMKVFNGIFKRLHRGFTQELRKLYRLNAIYLSPRSTYYQPKGQASNEIFQADYSGDMKNVKPAADPFYMSDTQRMQQATAVVQAAMQTPGYNLYIANKHYLEALRVPDIEELYPDPKGPNAIPPPPNPKMQIEQMKQQTKQADQQLKFKLAQLAISSNAEKLQAEIQSLHAQSIKALAEAKGVDTGHQIALIEAQIGAAKHKQDGMLQALKMIQDSQKEKDDGTQQGNGAGVQ